MGFLGAGAFCTVGANFYVVLAISLFDIASSAGHGLFGQIDAVGTHVGDFAVLVEFLGGLHGRFGAKTQA